MKPDRIICIVEGDGELTAVPTLVDRILRHLRRHRRLHADHTRVLNARCGDRITQPHNPDRQLGIEFFVQRAAREKPAGILVVVDAEDRCRERAEAGVEPLGPHLHARAVTVAGSIPVAVVVANRMFETWLLADFHSLRARQHLPKTATFPDWRAPEADGAGKPHLREVLGGRYQETVDQGRLASKVSLPLRRGIRQRAPSFHKLYRDVDRISRRAP
jgi:hypothetical protein